MADPSVAEAVALPPKEAIAFLRQKTNQTTERWTDVWNEAHARAFSVAGAASEALVQDFRAAVAKAIEQGTTLAEFRKDFDAIVAKSGWVHNGTAAWRSEIIYETNLSTAYSAGRYAQMTEPANLEAFPYWRYQHNAAIHPRQQHLDWSGLVLPASDPWWSTHYPPNGWRCHCSVSPVSEGGLRRSGRTVPDQAPPVDLQPRRIRTGEGFKTVEVPRGIDPGFGYNPGQAWLEHADRPVVGQLPARPPLRAEAVHVHPGEEARPAPPLPPTGVPVPAWASEQVPVAHDFTQWADELLRTRRADGTRRVVGVISAPVMQALGADAPSSRAITITAKSVLRLTRAGKADTVKAIAPADVLNLPALLRAPRAVLRELATGNLVFVFTPGDPEQARAGRLIVQLGMDVRAAGGGRLAEPVNGLKSGSLVPAQSLLNAGQYQLLEGSV